MNPIRRGAAVGLALAVAVALGLLVSPKAVTGLVEAVLFDPWFPAVLLGLYLVRPLLAWPITALSVVVGFRYGVTVGLPIALAGAVLTSFVPYVTARYVRSDIGWIGWATDGSERFFAATGDLRGVIAARLAPTPAEAISLAAGFARVSAPAFALGTAIGELPWTVAAVVVGHSMHRLSLVGVGFDPALLLAGLVAAMVLLVGPAYRHVRAGAA